MQPTHFLPISSLSVSPNRQRRVFDQAALRELADSLENPSIGLLHPIVVRQLGSETILVAGERRLRAIQDSHDLGVVVWHAGQPVPPGTIPATSLGEMDPLAAWEAELEENIRRTDLTWQEKAAATEALFALRSAQADNAGSPRPSITELAKEMDADRGMVREEVLVARQLADPEVKAAKSMKEALKVIKKKEDIRRNETLARQVGKTYSSFSHQVVHADSKDWLAKCPMGQFDVILTDPPYGMGADGFGDSGGKTAGAHTYDDSEDVLTEILTWLPAETFRVAKPEAHLYLFCDIELFPIIKRLFAAAGWSVFRTPLIWHKPTAYRAPWPDQGPQRAYETILYAVKGGKSTKRLAKDVVTCPPDENLGHMAQKPVALLQDLLSRSISPGDTILDPFGGTGSILPAAHALMGKATVVERDEGFYGIALARAGELK